jgi:uncharacterized membrane protein YtjA (UPF0391 family)
MDFSIIANKGDKIPEFCILFFKPKFYVMLRWTVIFLVVALIAAVFGFGGIAAGAASIAKVLFFIFIVLFLLSLIFGRSVTKSDV